jgi:uncharacterized protein involved in outer membrane biogenesis
MMQDTHARKRNRTRLWLALAALTLILAALIVPPYLSVSRYKARITQLISASLGRPVRLSSVEVRLLPRPGFVLTDLTVEEDPIYGAEPVLHANTVTASIRLFSLWRGRVELDTISVDEASLNLVRTDEGRWNLDPLMRSAAQQGQTSTSATPDEPVKTLDLPYFKATNSRINIKRGAEKLPYSLVNADISFWQQRPGDWRVRLRGQPARTDLTLDQADTGVVRLEAELRRAPELRLMPLRVDLEWREAQLGQLTRLLLGTDAGWRGDLTGELHLEGTADAAQIKTRLSAEGVHRAEFAPAAPMDFDANCALTAHFDTRAIDNLLCDSPLGSGHIRLSGNLPSNLPGQQGLPRLTVELDRIAVGVGLDALRTVRSGLAPGLDVAGSVSGKLTYAPVAAVVVKQAGRAKPHAPAPGPLTGSLTVDGLQLSGSALSQPIRIPKVILVPALPSSSAEAAKPEALTATAAIPAGAATPLTVAARFTPSGYQLTMRGQASILRGRELAHLASLPNAAALDALAGDPVTVDLIAEGPWMLPVQSLSVQSLPVQSLPVQTGNAAPPSDSFTGTVTLRNANWKPDYLVNAVLISQATLHLDGGELRWDPIAFSYGPVKGTASLSLPAACGVQQPCQPRFQLQFGALDAAVLQTAMLGAHEKSTLLSTLIERLRPAAAPAWPRMEGTVKADSLLLGPVTLHDAEADVTTIPGGAEITAFDSALLGGRVHGTGAYHAAVTANDKPSYDFDLSLEKLAPPTVGQLLGQRFSGGSIDGSGKIMLSGFTGADLAASAKGSLHFDWRHGAVSGSVPPALVRFDRWSADAEFANGTLTLKDNQVKRGDRTQPVEASLPLADPPRIIFAVSKPLSAKK